MMACWLVVPTIIAIAIDRVFGCVFDYVFRAVVVAETLPTVTFPLWIKNAQVFAAEFRPEFGDLEREQAD